MSDGPVATPRESPQFGRYPEYHDAGVEWLGVIPAHWEVRRLKSLCSRYAQYGANVVASSYLPSGVRFLRTTDINEHGQLKGVGVFLPEELAGDYLLADGDLLISRSGTVGRSFLYDRGEHGPCAYAGYLVRFVPSCHLLSEYAFYFTKSHSFVDFVRAMAISSTIDNVNGEKYANAPFPLPPIGEQTAIVDFLDRKTARTDALIAKQRELISLLQEKRTALINHAVTKGLDPDVAMKESGVEWLGEIPAHWEAKRTKFAATLRSGHTPSRQKPEYWEDCTIPWFGLADVWQIRDGQVDYVQETAEKISEIGLANSSARHLPAGTVILSRTASVGFSAILSVDMATTQDFVNWFAGHPCGPNTCCTSSVPWVRSFSVSRWAQPTRPFTCTMSAAFRHPFHPFPSRMRWSPSSARRLRQSTR